jgi:aldehyde dehydrogenase (NAD+)
METVLTRERALELLPRAALLIGGEWRETASGGQREHIDPSTGRSLGTFPVAGQQEVDEAVAAARAAFPAWRRTTADVRRRILLEIAARLRDQADEFSAISALESGSMYHMSPHGIAVEYFEYYAGWAGKHEGELISTYPEPALDYVKYEPYGVIGAIITWNGPVINAAMKVAAALAAGNCIVLKPPELGPFAVTRFGELCLEAGLPPGVLNILSGGPETGSALVRHPDVDKLSFTGGIATARHVMADASATLTPVVLELGGKSANIVFEDADLDDPGTAATLAVLFAANGQGCLLPSRLLVHDRLYDEVVARAAAIAGAMVVGDPFDPAAQIGPVISEQACNRILGVIDQAAAESHGRLIAGGKRLGGDLADGCFLAPTVFADVDNRSSLAQEEIFGPVLAIERFSDTAQAVALANDTKFGLAAYLHTRDLKRAHRVADQLDAGYVAVNAFLPIPAFAPFGGFKSSGSGKEGGRHGLEEFLRAKNVYISLGGSED